MNIGDACIIFSEINSERHSDVDKAIAIYKVMNMETHNSVTKGEILNALKWLWHQNYRWGEAGEQK